MKQRRYLRVLLLANLQLALFVAVSTQAFQKPEGQRLSSQQVSQPPVQSNGIDRIWSDPGRVEKLDLAGGPGGKAGAPKPPFTFVKELESGTSPKVEVTDAQNNTWVVKFGSEVNAEVFATRIAWAVGYFVDATYFLPSGMVNGVTKLGRAKRFIGADGTFADACLEFRDKNATRLKKNGWTWQNNPFVGTRELNGLKIVLMLTSNWDNKDARNESSNTGILQYSSKGGSERRYLVTDWGASMGRWGRIFKREKWDCEGFAEQTPGFIKGVKDGKIEWGYTGKHTSDTKEDITLGDVKWLLRYLSQLSDDQITMGLQASGANTAETQCFTEAIRSRIDQMNRLVEGGPVSLEQSTSGLAIAACR